MAKLPPSYFQQDDVVFLARDLIGKQLFTNIDEKITGGIITETEAYRGWGDRACHAHLNRRTQRTEIMYHAGGVAYVYLCYGIHHLFNIITNQAEHADAILIRAIEPIAGKEHMLNRRKKQALSPKLTAGPGNVSQALGINRQHYGTTLIGDVIWLEDGPQVSDTEIISTSRVGIDYAGEDAALPWRFYRQTSPFVSKR